MKITITPEQDAVFKFYMYEIGKAMYEKNDEEIKKIINSALKDGDITRELFIYINQLICGYDGIE